MARARNIKPGFFRNAELVELPFEYRLLFIGLWTLADREGRLFDRPKQIKMDVFPADSVNIDAGLNALMESGFLVRYEVDGIKAIQISNFVKHQNPHCKEQASEIPEPVKHGASTVQAQGENLESTGQAGLIPDSLIPDSLIPEDCSLRSQGEREETSDDDEGKKTRRKTSGTPKPTSLPDEFTPNEAASAMAERLGVSLEDELPGFRDHHLAKGSKMLDWQAAFRTWLGNAAKFGRASKGRAATTTPKALPGGGISGAAIGINGRIL